VGFLEFLSERFISMCDPYVMELRMRCVYAGPTWIDTVRIYEMPCDGMLRYIVRHMEEEDMWVFDDVKSALEFIRRELVVAGEPYHVGECPP